MEMSLPFLRSGQHSHLTLSPAKCLADKANGYYIFVLPAIASILIQKNKCLKQRICRKTFHFLSMSAHPDALRYWSICVRRSSRAICCRACNSRRDVSWKSSMESAWELCSRPSTVYRRMVLWLRTGGAARTWRSIRRTCRNMP
jgi:hypothetical protein